MPTPYNADTGFFRPTTYVAFRNLRNSLYAATENILDELSDCDPRSISDTDEMIVLIRTAGKCADLLEFIVE